jgi:hypothetical protein
VTADVRLESLEALVRDANPVPEPDDLVDTPDAAAVAVLVRRRRYELEAPQRRRPVPAAPAVPDPPRRSPARGAMVVALFVLGAFVVLALSAGGGSVPASQPPVSVIERSTTTSPPAATTAPSDALALALAPAETTTTTLAIPGPAGWSSILTTTRARPAPAPAVCPAGARPNAAGPIGQARPEPGWVGSLAGVFDLRTGRIVTVDPAGETWTFDVCGNTWAQMAPGGAPPEELGAGLAYDADSDVTVAFGFDQVAVYDAVANLWTPGDDEVIGVGEGRIVPVGAVYDPVSGLILTTHFTGLSQELWAYDVDEDEWTSVGNVWNEGEERYRPGDLLGYVPELDRLLFGSDGETTVLVDPRSGAVTLVATETPIVALGWPNEVYGPMAGTVYATTNTLESGDDICAFDPKTFGWTSCFDAAGGVLDGRHHVYSALVGDAINERLILIGGLYGDGWSSSIDDVWALDLDSGFWTQLLRPRRATG